jgi:hypothetical protein
MGGFPGIGQLTGFSVNDCGVLTPRTKKGRILFRKNGKDRHHRRTFWVRSTAFQLDDFSGPLGKNRCEEAADRAGVCRATPGGLLSQYPAPANEPVLFQRYRNNLSFMGGADPPGHFENIHAEFPDETMKCRHIRRDYQVFPFLEQAE